MKILFITSSSISGGAQKHIRDMFRCLTEQGNDVYLVAPSGWLMDELSNYDNHLFRQELSVKNNNSLKKIIDNIKPDVTNTFILSGAFFGVLAWKQKKYGKIFVTVNNPVLYDGISFLCKQIYPRLYRWLSKYASAFLVKSDAVSDEVAQIIKHKKPVLSIKNGIDFSVFDKNKVYEDLRSEYNVKKDDILISNVAALDERKGQRHIVDAVAELRNKYPIHAFFAGEGASKEALLKYVSDNNVQDFVHFIGRRSDVNRVLANSDIFILSSYHEGLPNALMEGLAMGLPCIATDVGGVRQLIRNDTEGIVINPKSSQEIKLAIEKFLDDKDFAHTCAQNGYKNIFENYKLETASQELKQIYLTY